MRKEGVGENEVELDKNDCQIFSNQASVWIYLSEASGHE